MSAGADRTRLLEGLVSACRAAGGVIMSSLGDASGRAMKSRHEVVTRADFGSERLLRERLRDLMPDASFIGEEEGGSPGFPCWIADPLDGTNNFAHGYPVFCVSVALVEETGPVLACVHDPTRGETFTSLRGSGAFLDGAPVRCSSAGSIGDSLLATGFPYSRTPEDLGFDLGPLLHFLGRAQGIRRGGSAALDLCYVACGRLDGFWEQHLRPWDMAAGCLLVTEAGGSAEAYEGGPWTIASGGVAAAAPGLAHELRRGIDEGRRIVEWTRPENEGAPRKAPPAMKDPADPRA